MLAALMMRMFSSQTLRQNRLHDLMFQLPLSVILGLMQKAGVDEESADDEEKEEDFHYLKSLSVGIK